MMQQGELFGDKSANTGQSTSQLQKHPTQGKSVGSYLADRDAMMELLNHWLELEWIRSIDSALLQLLAKLDSQAEPLVLLAIVLTSHQLGHGHICLDLQALLADPEATLLLPPEGQADAQHILPSQLLASVTLRDWQTALQRSSLVYQKGAAAPAPLALIDERLYLYRYWQYEARVAQHLVQRLNTAIPLVSDFSERLTALFKEPLVVDGKRQTDWQKVACAMAAQGQLTLITGGPGTGKTTTVVRLLALLQQAALQNSQALRIQLAAPTGKAAARLTESIGEQVNSLPVEQAVKDTIPSEVTTLHRLLGSLPGTRHFRHNSSNPLIVDVLVIDEASMIDLEMMHNVLDALPQHARLILLGDKDQLASVEAGSVLGDLCADAEFAYYTPNTRQLLEQLCQESLHAELWRVGDSQQHHLAQRTVMLRHSRRFDSQSGIGQLARAVNQGDQHTAWQLLTNPAQDTDYLLLNDSNSARFDTLLLGHNQPGSQAGYAHYLHLLQELRPAQTKPLTDQAWQQWASSVLSAFDEFRLLCALREGAFGVSGLNERTSQVLHNKGLIQCEQEWYEGRPVIVTQNDYSLGLMNGDIGVALLLPSNATKTEGEPEQVLRVAFSKNDGQGGVRFVLPSRLTNVETVFAMTVHKSQGSEFSHTALILPDRLNPVLTKELLYTGITRARSKFTLVEGQPGVFQSSVLRKVERTSGLNKAVHEIIQLALQT